MIEYDSAMGIICNKPIKTLLPEEKIVGKMSSLLHIAVLEGVEDFVIGLHAEISLQMAEELLKMKETYEEMKIYAVISYVSKSDYWNKNQRKRLLKIIKKSDEVFFPCEGNIGKNVVSICDDWIIQRVANICPVYTGDKDEYRRMVKFFRDHGKGYVCYGEYFP